jgi:hypothetical protein
VSGKADFAVSFLSPSNSHRTPPPPPPPPPPPETTECRARPRALTSLCLLW